MFMGLQNSPKSKIVLYDVLAEIITSLVHHKSSLVYLQSMKLFTIKKIVVLLLSRIVILAFSKFVILPKYPPLLISCTELFGNIFISTFFKER